MNAVEAAAQAKDGKDGKDPDQGARVLCITDEGQRWPEPSVPTISPFVRKPALKSFEHQTKFRALDESDVMAGMVRISRACGRR